MPPARADRKNWPGPGVVPALLLATVAVAAVAGAAHAQQNDGLRGGLASDVAGTPLLAGDGTSRTEPPPDYVPVSPGATPEAPAAARPVIFADDPGDDVQTDAERPPDRTTAATEETDDTTTGTVPQPAVDSRENRPLNPDAERAQPIEGLDRSVEANPYEAVGVRWGTFILKPSLETGITATSNADSSVDGSEAVLSETTLRLNAASDWASNSASVDAYGTFRKTLSGQEIDDVEGGVDAEMEIELGKDYRARGTFTYAVAPESAASPVVIPNTVNEPIRQTVGGTLGLEKDVGKARFAVTGGISHDAYGDAELQGGGTLSQEDRDATLYTLSLRAGYEIAPALTPFIETEIGRNQYDQDVDSAGYRRSSDRYAVRAGLAFDSGEKLSGEVAAGWIQEDFDDSRLESLSTPTVSAQVLWSPMRGTNVRLTGSTILEDTTTPGESGSVLYSTSVAVERQMRANLTGVAELGVAWRDYSGSDEHETIFDAEASLTWWLNRYAGVVGRIRHETVTSNLPDRESETNSIFLGLRLQR